MSYHGVDRNAFQQGPLHYNEQHMTQETEAGKLIAQMAVGITQDDIERTITHGHKYGREETLAPHPELMSPTHMLRVAAPIPENVQLAWEFALEKLVEKLPPDIQERVRYEMNLPYTARNEDYASLIISLSTLAYALAVVQTGAEGVDPASRAATVAARTTEAAESALPRILGIAREVGSEIDTVFALIGQGYPHIDRALELGTIHKEISAQLEKWQKSIREEALLAKEKAQLDQLLQQLYSVKEGVSAKSSGGFQILSDLLHVEIAAFSLLGSASGVKSSLLGLHFANIGRERGAGLLGKNMNALLGHMSDGALGILGLEKSSMEGSLVKPLLAAAIEAVLIAFHTGIGAQE